MKLTRRFLCPDCFRKLEYLGTEGNFALGTIISDVDILSCSGRHVWLRAHQPLVLETQEEYDGATS